MDFRYSDRQRHWIERVSAFMDEWVYPNVARYHEEQGKTAETRSRTVPSAVCPSGVTSSDHTCAPSPAQARAMAPPSVPRPPVTTTRAPARSR